MTPLLEARHLTRVFGGGFLHRQQTRALQDFSLRVESEPPSITRSRRKRQRQDDARAHVGVISPTSGDVL
jgi:hypothetical protein